MTLHAHRALALLIAALLLPSAVSAQGRPTARTTRAPSATHAHAGRRPLGRRPSRVATPPLEIPREASLQAGEGQNPHREAYRAWSSATSGRGVLHSAPVEGSNRHRYTVELNSRRGESRVVELTVENASAGRPARVVSMRPTSRWQHANLGAIAGRTRHETLRVDPIHRYEGEFNVVQRSVVQGRSELRVSTTGHVRMRGGVLHLESFHIADLSGQTNRLDTATRAYLRTHFVRQLAQRFPAASELRWHVPGADTAIVLPEGVTANRVVRQNHLGAPPTERQIHVDLVAMRN